MEGMLSTIIIGAIVLGLLVFAAVKAVKNHKDGGCGCGGCDGCGPQCNDGKPPKA